MKPQIKITRRRAGLLGLLIGDAYGVPYEFFAPGIPLGEIRFPPPDGFERSHRNAPAGAWSDDGARALALLDALSLHGANVVIFERVFLRNLVGWFLAGHYAVDELVFDVGTHTSAVLTAKAQGACIESRMIALRPGALGNGSLMGVLPCALMAKTDSAAVARARASSRATHGATPCVEACALYTCVARALLADVPGAKAGDAGVAMYHGMRDAVDAATLLVPDSEARRATGYVLHGLNLARIALTCDYPFERGIQETISLGGDTDTNAAIVGGLLALRDGKVPPTLLARLASPPWLEGFLEKL
jgi:ADP-ribosyl-[dinitrogen reductase] hydrolase